MISRILIIAEGGILIYSKNFIVEKIDNDNVIFDENLIAGFLNAISSFAMETRSGEIKSLNFGNVNFIYSYDTQSGAIFVILIDISDLEEEARDRLELMKGEFIKRYSSDIKNFKGDVGIFTDFDEFVVDHIFIPPKILLVGEPGVGKTTIMDLFPGETILELDDDLTEIIQKHVDISGIGNLKQFLLRELDLEDLVNNSKLYKPLLNTVDVICVVTNSAASNLSRTKQLLSRLESSVSRAAFYIIANFQDLKDASFKPKKIEKTFNIKTYGISAIQKDSKKVISSLFNEVLNASVVEKIKKRQEEYTKNEK